MLLNDDGGIVDEMCIILNFNLALLRRQCRYFLTGECVLSFKSALSTQPQTFFSVLTHLGEETGTIRFTSVLIFCCLCQSDLVTGLFCQYIESRVIFTNIELH